MTLEERRRPHRHHVEEAEEEVALEEKSEKAEHFLKDDGIDLRIELNRRRRSKREAESVSDSESESSDDDDSGLDSDDDSETDHAVVIMNKRFSSGNEKKNKWPKGSKRKATQDANKVTYG